MWRLRPLIFFPASKPRIPPLSVVFTDWLSITPAVGLGLLSGQLARSHNKRVVEGAQRAFSPPPIEVFLHRGKRWKVRRQKPSRTTRRSYIKKCVNYLTQVCLSRTSKPSGGLHQWSMMDHSASVKSLA